MKTRLQVVLCLLSVSLAGCTQTPPTPTSGTSELVLFLRGQTSEQGNFVTVITIDGQITARLDNQEFKAATVNGTARLSGIPNGVYKVHASPTTAGFKSADWNVLVNGPLIQVTLILLPDETAR